MRILLTYARRPPYPLFGLHLTEAFRTLGHQAILLGVRDRPWWGKLAKRLPHHGGSWQWDPVAWANAQLLQAARRYRADAILEIGGDLFTCDTLRVLKRRGGMRLALWLAEGPVNEDAWPAWAQYDWLASTSAVAVEKLRQVGFRHARYLPFATEPRWFRPFQQANPQAHNVGFVGAYEQRRAQFLSHVSDLGLHIWGVEWGRASSPELRQAIRSDRGAFGRALVSCYRTTLIHLNIQRERMRVLLASGERVGTGINFRLFDGPACGTFLLTERVQELPEAFAIGHEVETFTTPEELRDKTRYFLSHEPQRRIMIQRARARVLRDHTCRHRAQQWLKWFGA